jgi:hypothetical protein
MGTFRPLEDYEENESLNYTGNLAVLEDITPRKRAWY